MFDRINYKFNFIILFLVLTLIILNYWKYRSKGNLINLIINYFINFLSRLKVKKFNKNIIYFITIIFILILIINLMGLHPFIYSLTSQIRIVLILSSRYWICLNTFNIFFNYKRYFSHTIPEGTPYLMVVFLFLIEIIRNFIRPITLTLRLIGNIVAGHIFLVLIFMLVKNVSLIFRAIYVSYIIVEIIVCVLQAYIITTLMIMYYSEI